MIYGYIRISTDKQSVENQEFEILNYTTKNDLTINKWIKEVISSRENLEKRKLGNLLNKMKKNDILITSELSRLGRNLLEVMGILNYCMKKEVQIWTIKDNYKLGFDIQSKVLAFAFSLSAEIERDLISQRTKEALNRLKASGIKLGKPKGSKNKNNKIKGKEKEINDLLKKGVPKIKIAKLIGVCNTTLYYFLKKQRIK